MLTFEAIDVMKHQAKVIAFRKDSFRVSFGDTSGFGDEEDYLRWLEEKKHAFPAGFMLVRENDAYIGQLELSIKEYNGESIGYIHLLYLVPEKRGQGKGLELYQYAKQFFLQYNVASYELRVSPSNTAAINFYRKSGMEAIKIEFDGKIIRMRGMLSHDRDTDLV
ncbi:ribosomal-protein-alanine acetyltransferase [Oceanobacillus picturae]|uniref:Ribosomal-protein-alanine acetyltransferase n=1 Tax=Oceanobacillus picturae TaxID=171693 RepID=W9BEV2_9BACI|nr:GNAT family N-acetyltransferase [Oceanobacillus picturae]CDO04815.1 ribosomal-protein-alanine acetyltransferase [Oceanobacillus picturae]